MAILLIKEKKKCYKGRAWVDDFQRPIYGLREIRRGRNKGKLEVEHIDSHGKRTRLRKTIIKKTDIIKEEK